MYKRLLTYVLVWLSACLAAPAQDAPPAPAADSLERLQHREAELRLDSLFKPREDTAQRRLYQRLKDRMHRHRISRALFDFLFRDPYSRPALRTLEKPEDPNCALEGRFIGRITVQRLDPFGPRVTDTLRPPANWFEKAGNALHKTTRERVVRKSLLFGRGYPFVAAMLSDNERILRQLPFLLDARLYARPRLGRPDTVDIVVVTQDVWSISGGGGTDFQQTADAEVGDFNFLGLGHEERIGVSYSALPHPFTGRPRGWGVRSRYRVPYISNTFITGALEYVNQWNEQRHAMSAHRSFLTPSMKYAGGGELSYNRFFVESNPLAAGSQVMHLAYDYADLWLARSFRTHFAGDRTRMVLAARLTGTHFQQRPDVRPDTNALYQHRILNLYSLGFSTRNYLRDVYIYGFGRTEDVPYGSLFSVTTGVERREFGLRNYVGLRAAYGQYFRRFGYLLLGLNTGTFLQGNQWEQGAWRLETNYFSKLVEVGGSYLRQFVNVRYTRGFGRFTGEFIDINGNNGLRGITNNALRGQQSLVVNMETVLFTPLNLSGFQIALFGYADLGWIGASDRAAWHTPLYQGYGLGLRIRNENLTFNTFQLRLGFYNGFPGLGNPLRTEFSGIPRSRLPDFDMAAPEVVPFGNPGVR